MDSSTVITTKSGRVVHQRIDLSNDYDLSLTNNNDEDNEDDDDEDYTGQEQIEPKRKKRRKTFSISSMAKTDAIIYLDLRQSVATVSSEPTSDPAVEHDSELRTHLEKFLGVIPARRGLYNPLADCELQHNHMDEDDNLPCSTLHANRSIRPMTSLTGHEFMQWINAKCFERKTPQHIKEPVDLSCLPSERQRIYNCQQHKSIHNLFNNAKGYYSFLDSLRSETPLNRCHPLALDYRQPNFKTSKQNLAKLLFNAFNHRIFHCGLRARILWMNSMNTASSIFNGFQRNGCRVSHIILWQHIKQPEVVVNSLIHEMCHAAAYVYHGETGHGQNCRKWAYRAKSLLPELTQINDCNANYKYTCLLCRGCSFGITTFENKEEQLRCHYCQFEVIVETNYLSLLLTPYQQFVRDNYTKSKEISHSSKMHALNIQYKEQLKHKDSNL
ncbi:uncharacterized protein LOC117779879 [Drosophila innubila]|uniref:uncharacterized protein LOC117779879 n=1 Tax=Drosophila innubila TaxID=198719 RepID=UPI00148C1101|nr:uncharacterized protein LOC117779879 [Drosophila innubila]